MMIVIIAAVGVKLDHSNTSTHIQWEPATWETEHRDSGEDLKFVTCIDEKPVQEISYTSSINMVKQSSESAWESLENFFWKTDNRELQLSSLEVKIG